MKLRHLVLCLSSLGLIQPVMATTLTNNISGVGPAFSTVYPMYCLQTATSSPTVSCPLSHGQSGNAETCSGNQYYAGGAIRFGGCTALNTYLGYLDFNLNNNKATLSSYQPLPGLHIKVVNPAVDASGNITGTISYTPITANADIINGNPVATNASWNFVGFNLSGLEFSKTIDPTVVPNLSAEDAVGTGAQFSDFKEVSTLLNAGMNTVRLPIRSSYLQMEGPKGPVNGEFLTSYVLPTLESLTRAGIYTMVDMHDYMRYSKFGTQYAGCVGDLDRSAPCPDGELRTNARDWIGLWVKFYNKIKQDPYIIQSKLMFDLNNEPVDVPDDKVFTIQASIIKSLRSAGFTGYILVSGNKWDGLHSWFYTWPSADGKTSYSNATLFSRANFQAAGITDLSKIIINVHQYLDSDFSGNHDNCQTNLMTTGVGGFNLDAFTQWLQANSFQAMLTEFGGGKDEATCSVALKGLFDYMKKWSVKSTNTGGAYGYLGWTIWGVGHGWGDYILRVKPDSYHFKVMQSYLQPVVPMAKKPEA